MNVIKHVLCRPQGPPLKPMNIANIQVRVQFLVAYKQKETVHV
jgi:hypothetical protein